MPGIKNKKSADINIDEEWKSIESKVKRRVNEAKETARVRKRAIDCNNNAENSLDGPSNTPLASPNSGKLESNKPNNALVMHPNGGELENNSKTNLNTPSLTLANIPPSNLANNSNRPPNNSNNQSNNSNTLPSPINNSNRPPSLAPISPDGVFNTPPNSLLSPREKAIYEKGITQSTGISTSEENFYPERTTRAILESIRKGELKGEDLPIDERLIIVQAMKDEGWTQDKIADAIGVTRRTITSDYRRLREHQALQATRLENTGIAGEVYDLAQTCIRQALSSKRYKTAIDIQETMVNMLMDLGIILRAPKTLQQLSLHANLNASKAGYNKYLANLGEDTEKVCQVLDEMMKAVSTPAP